jgi:acetoin utilization protein AcuB
MVKAMKLLAGNDANVVAAGVYHNEERGTEVFIKATGEIAVEKMTNIFKENELNVVNIIQTTKEGMTVTYNPSEIN